jgi:hypothetical protein
MAFDFFEVGSFFACDDFLVVLDGGGGAGVLDADLALVVFAVRAESSLFSFAKNCLA